LIFLQTKISEPFLALCQYQFAIASNNPQSGDAFRKNVQALRSQNLFEFFKIFEYGTYTCICPFCIKIWKAESLLQTITELSIKELICTGFRKCSTKIGICIFSSARFVKIMFPLAFSELWPYFEFSDENCLQLLVQLPDVIESVPSRRRGSTCGTRKPPGKHSAVILPLCLQSFCSPLFEAGFGLHGVDLRLWEDLFEPRCALL
jgi:hypothetical protein